MEVGSISLDIRLAVLDAIDEPVDESGGGLSDSPAKESVKSGRLGCSGRAMIFAVIGDGR